MLRSFDRIRFDRIRFALRLFMALLTLSCYAVADAGLDTETYINATGSGFGEINGDRTGLGLVTLEDQRGGDLWNTGDTCLLYTSPSPRD